MIDIEYFHKLGKTVTQRDINDLEAYFKSEGRLRHNKFGANTRSLIIPNYEEYKFQLKGDRKYKDTDEYIIIRYPGFTEDENYKESFMANIIGIPSDKHSKKYYDRRRY